MSSRTTLANLLTASLAAMMTGEADRHVLANQIEQVSADLVELLQAQVHTVVDGAA